MKNNLIYNSLNHGKQENFLYDFFFSKNPDTNNNLGVDELPRFRLKNKNSNDNNPTIEVPKDKFVYQFSGHGDKSTIFKDKYISNKKYFYERTYCSQIMSQLETNDFAASKSFPIFIFGSKLDCWKSINVKKIRLKLELFNTNNSQINFSNTNDNLLRIFAHVTQNTSEVTDIFPQKIVNQGIIKAELPTAYLPNSFFKNISLPPNNIINLQNLGVITPNNANSTKNIIYYEIDSSFIVKDIVKNTNILFSVRLNNSVVLGNKLDKVNMKLTSNITINDNLNSPVTDNF